MAALGPLLASTAQLVKPDRAPEDRARLQEALKELRSSIEELQPGHLTRHGEDQVNPATIPWVSAFPQGADKHDPQSGYYVTYLFASDGQHVNLCLTLGTSKVPVRGALRARAYALREFCDDSADLELAPALTATDGKAATYADGTVVAKVYDPASFPPEEQLQQDLERFLAFADRAYASGLRFREDSEPIHLVYPWVEDQSGPGIVKTRKAIADEKGASWWVTNTRIAADKLAQVRAQLDKRIPTYVYLYAAGDSWRTKLAAITDSSSDVTREPDLLAAGATPIEGRLAMKLSDFQPMPTTWAGEGLFGKKGTPVSESFAGRPSFTYVYSGLTSTAQAATQTPSKPLSSPRPTDVDEELVQLAKESGLPLDYLHSMHEVLQGMQPQLILAGPPGTGKTWLAKALASIGNSASAAGYQLVQFHPSYAYEDFIEGLRPVAKDGTVVFQNQPGHLLQLVQRLPNGPSTLIIDEMNRANIPSVFGELMYLLEYRGESVKLRLSGDFSLPREVRFIATMNTADRSIRSVDAALRRRFEYFEVFPDAQALSNYYSGGTAKLEVPDLVAGFTELNTRLAAAIDRHHGIGHSFFMREKLTPNALAGIWKRQVRPLIDEYFFDEPNRVDEEFKLTDLWPSLAT